mmetsp:Transcript_17131/g.35749  ORF Transcript_17131/g.35749 Transcript_17131/m.35749 type:complete len:121 (+) Transcript_17131:1096-1458(+)
MDRHLDMVDLHLLHTADMIEGRLLDMGTILVITTDAEANWGQDTVERIEDLLGVAGATKMALHHWHGNVEMEEEGVTMVDRAMETRKEGGPAAAVLTEGEAGTDLHRTTALFQCSWCNAD